MDRTRSFTGISFLIGVFPWSRRYALDQHLPPVYKSIEPVTTVHLGDVSSTPPLLYTAYRSVFSEYTLLCRWTVSAVKNEAHSFLVHLTLGILAKISSIFHALSFFWLDGFAVPAPAQVTQTVRLLYAQIEKRIKCRNMTLKNSSISHLICYV